MHFQAAINLLSSKLNLLEPNYLDQVESRFAVLHQCMQQVSEKKHQIEDAEKQNKIAELYELAKKVDDLSTSLPQVVERLVSLKDLHEQGIFKLLAYIISIPNICLLPFFVKFFMVLSF